MKFVLAAGVLLASVATCAVAQTFSADELTRRATERRAVEAVIWGMPAVNYDLMRQEMLSKTPGKVGQVIYWGRPLDWRNQTLTPNPDALYFMVFCRTGPAAGRCQRLVQRQHCHRVANAAGRRWPARH
jgi:hypothetical protein